MEEAELLGALLPLQRFLPKPVAFSEAAQVDRLSIGQIFPSHINLVEEWKWLHEKKRGAWQGGGWKKEKADRLMYNGMEIVSFETDNISFTHHSKRNVQKFDM